ncbi:MAG TPA: cupredoxin domain-containing protein [Acidimicrobiales bacterium]|nr:cupredoxin domain-containing protein [Acidimicrobiales bacterium]
MPKRSAAAPALALLALLAACQSTGGDAVAITATDTTCVVAKTDLAAGKTTFAVTNGGKKVTEVYVYGPEDRVVTERENIGPGTKATFSADLAAGTYEVACKPGQTGNGIRQAIKVTGAGGAAAKPADKEFQIVARDYAFTGLEKVAIAKGETVEFELVNRGNDQHELEVFPPSGDKSLGEVGPTNPGRTGKVTLTFDEPGTYRVVCGVDDHEHKGMVGTFTVTG